MQHFNYHYIGCIYSSLSFILIVKSKKQINTLNIVRGKFNFHNFYDNNANK